jgi:uncharacterized membrane protein
MTQRMATAVLSLLGLFVAAYLWLYKAGYIGTLACGAGGCETVQLSPYSVFLGVDVALYGIAGYLTLFALSLLGLHPTIVGRAWPDRALVVLSGIGVAFTLYLTWLELFVIHAVCRWCVASAVIITLIFLAALTGTLRRTGAPAPA